MRPLIDTLIRAFIALSNVMFLLIFFLAVFAILGHELFGAKLHVQGIPVPPLVLDDKNVDAKGECKGQNGHPDWDASKSFGD